MCCRSEYSAFLFIWLISFNIMPSRSIQVFTNGFPAILWLNNIPACICIYHIFFIHSSTNGPLAYFLVLAVVNNAILNIGEQISISDADFISFGYIPRNGIAKSYGNSIFEFLRNLYTVFQVVVPIYIPTNVSKCFFLHSCHHLLSLVFLMITILTSMRW